jgi:hypothetical protein
VLARSLLANVLTLASDGARGFCSGVPKNEKPRKLGALLPLALPLALVRDVAIDDASSVGVRSPPGSDTGVFSSVRPQVPGLADHGRLRGGGWRLTDVLLRWRVVRGEDTGLRAVGSHPGVTGDAGITSSTSSTSVPGARICAPNGGGGGSPARTESKDGGTILSAGLAGRSMIDGERGREEPFMSVLKAPTGVLPERMVCAEPGKSRVDGASFVLNVLRVGEAA